ncbi:MAG: RagB/SusD family nutrient uptake outer membrane protein [Bacteroidales bacterium]|nr:RagB/SusD family nutrient uptake outer membrane protein [Bacteroidales bacterium]
MKSNRFKYLPLMLLMAVVNLSCDSLLDVPPQGKLSKEEFWLSKDQAAAAVAGIYNYLGNTNYNFKTGGSMSNLGISPVESYIFWGEIRGELLGSNLGRMPAAMVEKEKMDALNVSPADITTSYTQFYKIINLANLAIKYLPEVKKNDPAFTAEMETNLIGEAYFLRAYAYFWLVRAFKEVPLVLVPSETDDQDYDVPKSSADALYAQIVSDLNMALPKLPDWYVNQQYAHCRATKNAARVVLADVCLTMASLPLLGTDNNALYEEAVSQCDSIIDSRRYSLVPGISLASIFTNGATDESILEVYGNSLNNKQVNNLNAWTLSSGYFVATNAADQLFLKIPMADYRSSVPPAGPYPAKGTAVSYNASSKYIAKYISGTRDARWIFYRYPEVLLLKAEALAHRYKNDPDKLTEACDLVNQVRFRAYGVNDYPKATATSTYEMDNILLDERGREFFGEGKRWFELVRFASREDFIYKELLVDRIVQSYGGVDQLVMAPRVNNPDSWYLPLNSDVLDASGGNLIQNPYYQ